MELHVLISKKGTKVVTATNLYEVLGLSRQDYTKNVKKWLKGFYAFSDGLRVPEALKDFAPRKNAATFVDDFYLSVEFAKLICLQSASKVKRKYARLLLAAEEKGGSHQSALAVDQVVAVLEITKVMSLASCQRAAERNHLELFKKENGSAASWWSYRAGILGYSSEDIKSMALKNGISIKKKSQRDLLILIDKYETIRAGVIDYLLAQGKSISVAQHMGNLAKIFAREMELDIWEDQKQPVVFSTNLNQDLINAVRNSDTLASVAA